MGFIKSLYDALSKSEICVDYGRKLFGSRLVNDSRLYEILARRMAKIYDEDRPYGNLRLNIETTLACNAQCVICTKKSYPLKVGRMSSELYEKIIHEAKELDVKKIILSIYGEPLMDRNFIERARLADEANMKFSFFTNGSLLTQKKAKALLKLEGFHKIYFSVNGFSKNTYEDIMINLNRDVTYQNILDFLQLKKEMGSKVKVNVNCVLFKRNVHEKDQLKKYFEDQDSIDQVYFPVLRNRGGTVLDIEIGGHCVEFSPLAQKGRKLHPCKFLWEDLFIFWNGDVGVCCEDMAARRIIIGNLNSRHLRDIWAGKKMQALRKIHIEGKRYRHAVCGKQCTYNTVWLKPYA